LRFEEIRSDALNLRVSPSFKLSSKASADYEQRSMVNMVAVLVANYCEKHHIAHPGRHAKTAADKLHLKVAV
jgi:hypothetical protein